MFLYELGKPVVAVAPMLGWTDRHCRFFHRQLYSSALLYTEMLPMDAFFHQDRTFFAFHPQENPVALQVGGCDPYKLSEVARIVESLGYDEINLNAGCPSPRVQSGSFGAFLMYEPQLLGACVKAMRKAVRIPVTVKCRIGVDQQDVEIALDCVADAVFSSGADALWVHARKAWLKGLSPKENRTIPPLDYARVYRLKEKYSNFFIGMNGGVDSALQVKEHLRFVDGVMVGRAAYHRPEILFAIDCMLQYGFEKTIDYEDLLKKMCIYCEEHIAQGGKLSHVTRHMMGLFHGLRGCAFYRRFLAENANSIDVGAEILYAACSSVVLEKKSLFP